MTQAAKDASTGSFNGLDTQQLMQTVDVIKGNKTIAKFEFRARNQWIDGTENRSTIQGFHGAGAEDTSRTKPFTLIADEPPVLLGNNLGANPGELLLHALAGCVTTTTILHATARGIRIESISTELSGDVDLQGALGLDESVAPGFSQITMKMDVKADCPDKELDELLAYVKAHSPVCDTVCRPVPVTLVRVRATNPPR